MLFVFFLFSVVFLLCFSHQAFDSTPVTSTAPATIFSPPKTQGNKTTEPEKKKTKFIYLGLIVHVFIFELGSSTGPARCLPPESVAPYHQAHNRAHKFS